MNTAQRVTARYYALNFVLAYGESISDCAGELTDCFTETLIEYEDTFFPVWHTMQGNDRFRVAYFDAATEVLEDDLPGLFKRLFPHERFEWRIKICRLLLSYLAERSGQPGGELDSMLDYYFLVHDGIRDTIDNRGFLLNPDNWQASDQNMEITINPN